MGNLLKRIKAKLKSLIPSTNSKKNQDHLVFIGERCNISTTAIVESRKGGEIKIGACSDILDGVLILTYGGDVSIGHNCSINPYTIIYGHGGTKIGNNVLIAGHTMIIPNNHNFEDKHTLISEQGVTSKGITIEDDVWIGHGCTILDGVKVAKGCVIAAGSVINKDTEEYGVYAGVPAKKIKSRQ